MHDLSSKIKLRDSSMAVVVPYDTAGKDVYKLLHMMAFDHDHGAAASKDIDYFEEIKRASDLMTDQEKEIIDTKVFFENCINPFY